jgi:O-methyltransferase
MDLGSSQLRKLFETVRQRPDDAAQVRLGHLAQHAVTMYLDLMKLCLTDSIYGSDDPGPNFYDDQYDRDIRLRGAPEGENWPSHAHTMIGLPRLNNIQDCVEAVLRDNVPGDLIETGVWRGGATIFMRAILEAYGVTDRAVWVADSFKGLPPPQPDRFPADEGLDLNLSSKLAVPLETVRANFASYGLLDDRVKFVEGFFEDTLPPLGLRQLSVLRLDGDLYASTWVALETLYPLLSSGGYAIIDDYGAIDACRLAIHDFRAKYAITEPIQYIDYSGVFWRRA